MLAQFRCAMPVRVLLEARCTCGTPSRSSNPSQSRYGPDSLPPRWGRAEVGVRRGEGGKGQYLAGVLGLFFRLIQSQIQGKDIHAWFAQQPQGAALGVLGHQLAHGTLAQPTCLGDPTDLIGGRGGAYVRI